MLNEPERNSVFQILYGSRNAKMKIKRKDPTTPPLLSMDIKLQSFDPLDSSSHQTGDLLLHSFPKLCHYTGDRGRGRTTLPNEYTYIHTHTHREHSSWKSCKVETPRFGITSGAKVAAGKGGVLSICPFSSPFFRYTPIRIKAKEGENERDNSPSRRDAIW